MNVDLTGKHAIVTGSGRSLGRAIALGLANAGANVAVNSRSTPDEIETVAAEIRALGRKSIAVAVDVSTREGADELVRRAEAELGPTWVLVNTVGISPKVPILEMTEDDWRHVLAVNLDSVFFCCKAVLPGMVARHAGRIINVSGHAHIRGDAERSHVSAGKAGNVGFSRSLARELAPHGILVNVVAPGSFDTPERTRYYRDFGEGHANRHGMMGMIALGRLGQPDELASVCVFLASEHASFITGQTLLVNGGMVFG
jgi:NAD(P)-dependent dehydrogenase (short-subunit alcohol dehydrogenase family)